MSRSRRLRRHRFPARRRLAFGIAAGGAAGIAAGIGVSAFMNAVTTNAIGLSSGAINAEGALSTPTVSGRDVSLSWPADTLSDGTPTTYYVLRDSSGAGGTCGGVLSSSTLSCTDTGVPSGAHTYTVVPTYLMWSGPPASAASPVVGTPSLGLSPTSTTTLPTDAAATVSNFLDSETVTFRLDDATSGTVLATSPGTVSTGTSGGAASPTVTIPANIAGGSHTVYAVGNLGDQASATFTVNVPPTLSFSNGTFSSLPATLTGGAITYFRAGESVTFHLDTAGGTLLSSSPASVSVGANGQTGSAFTVTVPAGIADGTHTVYAVGGSGSQATYSISVQVPSTLSITAAQNLTTLPGTVSGGAATSFAAGENLVVRLDSVTGTILSTTPSTVTTDGNGQASGFSVTIPSGIADGTHTLVALGNTSGLSATSNSFTVNAPSTFSITGGQSLPASTLPAAVSGGAVASFNGAENLTIHLDTASGTVLVTTPSTVTTSAQGQATGFSATIPSGTLGGSHTLWAVGNTSGRSAQSNSFTVAASATGLSPTSGPVGTSASIVAQGFLASHALSVTVAGTSASITGGATTNSSGAATVSFTIPAVPNGAATVVVSDGTSSATSATSFGVTASATGLAPTSGVVGTTGVSINASGFVASHALTVTVGGNAATVTSGGTAGSNGSSTVQFTIPAAPNGPQAVVVSDGTNTATSATSFSVVAAVSVSPSSGTVGTTGVTLTGTGFVAGKTVSVTFGGSALTLSPAAPTVNGSGGWSATFTVPASVNGARSVVATDTGSASASTTFTVSAALTVSPSSAASGTTGVTLTGSGYISGRTISATFAGSAVTLSPATPTVNSTGGWSATFTVPSSTAGAKTIVATDSGGASAQTTFTVTAATSQLIFSSCTFTGTAGTSTCSTTGTASVVLQKSNQGGGGTWTAKVTLTDGSGNAVTNPGPGAITVTVTNTTSGATITFSSGTALTIPAGASQSSNSFTYSNAGVPNGSGSDTVTAASSGRSSAVGSISW